jgi:hypothetical protein
VTQGAGQYGELEETIERKNWRIQPYFCVVDTEACPGTGGGAAGTRASPDPGFFDENPALGNGLAAISAT